MDLFEKMSAQLSAKLPFAVYCKPGSDWVTGIFQHDGSLNAITDFTETGFAFVSFEADEKYYLPFEKADVLHEKKAADAPQVPVETQAVADPGAKNRFETLVENAVNTIEKGAFKKVVLSRSETLEINHFDPVAVVKQLQYHYPLAFTYCFFHPQIGMWLGATPELLLKADGANVQTVALAGTKLLSDERQWGNKEQDEQQLVTDFIAGCLGEHCHGVSVSAPYTEKAGHLAHIKTDISATLNSGAGFDELITSLHPTPAVCGLPKETAKRFILENEGYDRKFYTGFLGELNIDLKTSGTARSDLFVNLRCMEARQNTVIIYVGCGITKDSVPESEFAETQNKSMTMRKVVNLSSKF